MRAARGFCGAFGGHGDGGAIMRRAALCLVIGFVAQALVLLAVLQFGLPDRMADTLGLVLLPGVALIWGEGIHSGLPLIGFAFALLVNTSYYAILTLIALRLVRRFLDPRRSGGRILLVLVSVSLGDHISQHVARS